MSDIMSGVMACHISWFVTWHAGVMSDVMSGVMNLSYFCYLGPHAKFQKTRTTFEITPLCAPKYSIVRGVGPPFFWIEILIFL